MAYYSKLGTQELKEQLNELQKKFAGFCAKGLQLNMARGKPSAEQLHLSAELLGTLDEQECAKHPQGDLRNYGAADGLESAKELFAFLLDDEARNITVYGNSSLAIMYDLITDCYLYGPCISEKGDCATPWGKLDTIKWLCPSPGYDRHFAISEALGMEMIVIPMTPGGPDMDIVEKLAANDELIKGIWCVPKYSNPGGVSYCNETVRRLAGMACAAEDFRIFWDNAYGVHHLYDEPDQQDQVLDIGIACQEAKNPLRYFKFASTSKITFSGAGLAGMAAWGANVDVARARLGIKTIGYDKLNQFRHVRFLRNGETITALMRKHGALLRPKFELVDKLLTSGLAELAEEGVCSWSKPRGGYFVSFDAPCGCAKRTVDLAKQAGVIMTGAGATYPGKNDVNDSNIRIAPSFPPLNELEEALEVFICCVKIAYIERLLCEKEK